MEESLNRKTKEIVALYNDILTFRQMITDICQDTGKNYLTERRNIISVIDPNQNISRND